MEAFDFLKDVADRSALANIGINPACKEQDNWSGIAFQCFGKNYLAPLDKVSEIIRVPKIKKLPGAVDWLLGVSNLRGNLLLMIDLQGFLFKEYKDILPTSIVMVVKHENTNFGVLVDKLIGIESYNKEKINENINNESLKKYCSGKVIDELNEILIIDFSKIASLDEFYNVRRC